MRHVAAVKLFITDALMPVMDGAQAIAELCVINAKLPVIISEFGFSQRQVGDSRPV